MGPMEGIANLSKIVVFPRSGYLKKPFCKAIKTLGKKKILFMRSKKSIFLLQK